MRHFNNCLAIRRRYIDFAVYDKSLPIPPANAHGGNKGVILRWNGSCMFYSKCVMVDGGFREDIKIVFARFRGARLHNARISNDVSFVYTLSFSADLDRNNISY